MDEKRAWRLYWEDDNWSSGGIIEVLAATKSEAYSKGDLYMDDCARRDQGPASWHWVYEPTDKKPKGV